MAQASHRRADDSLDFHEIGQAVAAVFAAVSGLLVAAEGGGDVGAPAVDRDQSSAKPRRDLRGGGGIAGDGGGQAVIGVVGERDRFVLIAVAGDRRDRSERLLPRDAHVGGNVGEQRRPDVEAGIAAVGATGAARHQRRPLIDRGLDQALDLVILRLVDDGTDMLADLRRVAHLGLFHHCLHDRGGVRDLALVNQKPGRGDAALPRIGEHAGDGRGQHRLKISALEHEIGCLAAQFLMHALDRPGRRLRDRNPCAGRAGEADHVDARVRAERRADAGAVAVDEVEHAGRHARTVHDLGKDHRAAGGLFGRFQDHRVARRERGCDLGADLVERPVPRRDHCDDAERFVNDARLADHLFESEAFKRLGGDGEMSEAGRRLSHRGKAHRRAHLFGHRLCQIGNARLVFGDDPPDQVEPFGDAGARPCRKRAAGGGDGPVDIGGGAERDLADRLFGRRVDYLMGTAAVAVDPFAVDIVLQVAVHAGSPDWF